MTLGTGQYFTRNETWAEQAKPWIDYLSRSSFMLQAGKAANNIAVFYGESSPVISQYRNSYPLVPEGYRYDYVNADAILNRLFIDDGALVTSTDMSYKVLYFGNGTEKVTLPVLKKVLEFVQEGAVLIGTRPEGSPSLADDPSQVAEVLNQLWPGQEVATVGKGRVYNSAKVDQAILDEIKLEPDFTYRKPQPDSNIMFICRKLNKGSIYFLANQIDRSETIEASFLISGYKAELWDPATGKIKPASYEFDGNSTKVTINLECFGSVFVVFREKTKVNSVVIPEPTEQEIALIEGPWQVEFQAERGAPASAIFEKLTDFRESTDPGIRYFSGIATYIKDIELSQETIDNGDVIIDLGQVYNLAEVWVNGKLAGTTWKPPYRVEITDFVTAGSNKVEIKSVNTWVNRLIGDAQPGVIEKVTLTTSNFYRADSPMVPSGLIGPVRIISHATAF